MPDLPGEQSERVELAAQLDGYCDHADGTCFCAKSNTPWEQIERDLREAASLIDQQAVRVRELEAALAPFAALADEVDRHRHFDESTCPHRLRAGDIRTARDALDPERNTETDG